MRERIADRKTYAILLCLTCALAMVLACAAGCAQGSSEAGGPPISVKVTIDGTEGGHGMIYDGSVQVSEGSSVYDALLATNVDVSVKSSMGMGAYVQGIDGLMEKEQSSTSGWLYSVNGEVASVGCDAYTLSDGDVVKWEWRVDALSPQ